MSTSPAPALPLPAGRYRSKTLAAWLALLLGACGAHRLYLHGPRDLRAWLPLPFTLLGLAGVIRMRNIGLEDAAAALLAPLLGLAIAAGMFAAIVIALTPDEKWHARHNGGRPGPDSGWGAVLAAVVGLFVGATVLMSTVAFSIQRFFEWETQAPATPAVSSDRASPVRTASR